jgi:hypothetical protein
MPVGSRSALARVWAVLLVFQTACARDLTQPQPVATLASSPEAAAAFEAIREAWRNPDRIAPDALRRMIERFLIDYPKDGLVPLASVSLALVAMAAGDFAHADAELARTEGLPPGTARDLWTTARARELRLRGDAERALALLAPLVGKNVDPLGRLIFEEELTLSALATGRDYEAISYMDAWLRASAEEDRAHVLARVSEIVEHLSVDVLVGALRVMRAQRASLGYGMDIERILSDRLVREATTSGNAELALMLLDPSAAGIPITGDAGLALGQVATTRRGLNVVAGRTIGLLLPTRSGLRDESADVLRGVTWALGLPAGVRSLPASREPPDESRGPRTLPCGAPETAPDAPEPEASEGVHLVTRNDTGERGSTEIGLDELAGEGAAIVIAGLDAPSAARATQWGERHRVPIVVLATADPAAEALFAFSLGVPRGDVVRALVQSVPALATGAVAPIIDASEVDGYPASIGATGLRLVPPIACDAPTGREDEPRFPLHQWELGAVHEWLVSGAARCASDLAVELGAAHAHGTIALTLEAARLLPRIPGLRVITAQAGAVPASGTGDPRGPEIRRFSEALGPLTWWAALGRDAATLARTAVLGLPSDLAAVPQAVTDRRAQARDRLTTARGRLWSTEAAGWRDTRTIQRTVCTIDASATGTPTAPGVPPVPTTPR